MGGFHRTSRRLVWLLAALVVGQIVAAGPASAYTFTRTLGPGDKGPDVKVLQIRVAGWYGKADQSALRLDGSYGSATVDAVKAFQAFYGLEPDGVAGPSTIAVIDGLEDDDGSTLHFDWIEFTQNRNANCSAKANAYAGTFKGGMTSPLRTKKNVKKLMWRLEALRAKAGGKPVGINSAYRSVTYNDCIGGARASQHMYGTAVDNRMAEVDNRSERELAKATQFHGIGCYSSLSHNHFDIRLDNTDLDSSRHWWWPERDDSGRDLADDGKPCWGEKSGSGTKTASTSDGASAPLLPSARVLQGFSQSPEWYGGLGD
ncbi:MAG: D-Ala-D-Ala carboxypeptidase family metallohydrolase [Actinomycetota bacterium]|nr:D-Ala-D-Ala carboxypeptidase family metallohydrolase [Actinomycetota bacterium]